MAIVTLLWSVGFLGVTDDFIIGTGAVVVKDLPSNVIVAGNPAKIIQLNEILIKKGPDRRIMSNIQI